MRRKTTRSPAPFLLGVEDLVSAWHQAPESFPYPGRMERPGPLDGQRGKLRLSGTQGWLALRTLLAGLGLFIKPVPGLDTTRLDRV